MVWSNMTKASVTTPFYSATLFLHRSANKASAVFKLKSKQQGMFFNTHFTHKTIIPPKK